MLSCSVPTQDTRLQVIRSQTWGWIRSGYLETTRWSRLHTVHTLLISDQLYSLNQTNQTFKQCVGFISFWFGWIQILDAPWKIIDPDRGHEHFFQDLQIFLNIRRILNLVFSSFINCSELGFEINKFFFCSFWLIIYPVDPDQQKYQRSGSRKPNCCGSNESGSWALLIRMSIVQAPTPIPKLGFYKIRFYSLQWPSFQLFLKFIF